MPWAPASLHCSMSRRQAASTSCGLGDFPLKVQLFLSCQMCQASMATMVLTPLLSVGAAELKIAVTASVVDLQALQEAGESAAQPPQVAALIDLIQPAPGAALLASPHRRKHWGRLHPVLGTLSNSYYVACWRRSEERGEEASLTLDQNYWN
jgi:hypothetical protein